MNLTKRYQPSAVAVLWLTAGCLLGAVSITTFFDFTEISAPGVSALGAARIYMDSTSKTVKMSVNGGAYSDLVANGYNVKSYGAKCDGATDDTVAIQAALTASNTVYVPSGTCISGALTVARDNTTIYGDGFQSVLSMKSGVNNTFLITAGTHPLNLSAVRLTGGGAACGASAATCPTTNGRGGISIPSQKGCFITHAQIDGFDDRAIFFNDSARDRVNHCSVDNTTIFNSKWGIQTATGGFTEYVRLTALDVSRCGTGVSILGGNVILANSKINDCGVGLFLSGTGASNNGHGVVSGNQINHSSVWSVQTIDLTLGMALTGNVIADGPLWIKDTSNLFIMDGEFIVQSFCLDGGGRNVIRNNNVRSIVTTGVGSGLGNLVNTVTHSCNGHADDTVVIDNAHYQDNPDAGINLYIDNGTTAILPCGWDSRHHSGVALDGASPSVCTTTVAPGSKCHCTGVAELITCRATVSGTTATCTCANGSTDTPNVSCVRGP